MIDLVITFVLFFIGIIGYAISNGCLVKYVISAEIIFLSAVYLFINSDEIFGVSVGGIFVLFLIIVSIVDVCVYIFLQDMPKDSKQIDDKNSCNTKTKFSGKELTRTGGHKI